MARAEDHIHLANKNHEALLHVLTAYDRLPEWVATIAFYKSVQIVDAMCVERRKRCPTGHFDRLDWLQRTKELMPLYKPFRALHAASSIARYLSDKESKTHCKCFSEYLSPEDVIDKLIVGRLIPIEQYSISQFRDPLRNLLVQTDSAKLPKSKPEPNAAKGVSPSVATPAKAAQSK